MTCPYALSWTIFFTESGNLIGIGSPSSPMNWVHHTRHVSDPFRIHWSVLRVGGAAVDTQDRPDLAVGSPDEARWASLGLDRKSTRLNSSHDQISYAVF